MRFAVDVLTKRGGVRTRYVSAPNETAAKAHVLRTMKKSDERVLRVCGLESTR